jgi:hypothetical protein
MTDRLFSLVHPSVRVQSRIKCSLGNVRTFSKHVRKFGHTCNSENFKLSTVLFIYSERQLAFSVSSWPGASFQNRTYWDGSALFWIPENTVPSSWRQAVVISRWTTHLSRVSENQDKVVLTILSQFEPFIVISVQPTLVTVQRKVDGSFHEGSSKHAEILPWKNSRSLKCTARYSHKLFLTPNWEFERQFGVKNVLAGLRLKNSKIHF